MGNIKEYFVMKSKGKETSFAKCLHNIFAISRYLCRIC